MNNEEMYRRWEKEEGISKTSMKIYYFILFLVIGFLIVSTVIFLRGHYSYEFYAKLNILYDILISNIGVTAVIAIAALGFTAFNSHKNKELINFIIISVSSLGLAIVVILSYCRFSGSTTIIPLEDNQVYRGRIVGEMADGRGEIYNAITGERIFLGYFRMNQKNGFGISIFESEDGNRFVKYIGDFSEGKYSDKGYEFEYKAGYENSSDENGFIYSIEIEEKNKELIQDIALDKDVISNCYICYEGTYINGLKEGIGKSYSLTKNGERYMQYEGEFANGAWQGKGIQYKVSDSGQIYKYYEGEFYNSSYEGSGTIYALSDSGEIYKSYEGDFSQGREKGNGTSYKLSQSGDIYISYVGEFDNGFRDGKGTFYKISDSGERYLAYEGDFKEGRAEGEGRMYRLSESGERYLVYEGGVKDGCYEGTGVWYAENGERYEGEFHEGLCHGYGIYYYSDGNIEFEGNYIEGVAQK